MVHEQELLRSHYCCCAVVPAYCNVSADYRVWQGDHITLLVDYVQVNGKLLWLTIELQNQSESKSLSFFWR